jgi:hypothetical protein
LRAGPRENLSPPGIFLIAHDLELVRAAAFMLSRVIRRNHNAMSCVRFFGCREARFHAAVVAMW